MATWRQQALIEAPVKEVWEILADPVRGPDWDQDVLAIIGAPAKIEKGSTFELTGRGPMGLKGSTTFRVEEFEEMNELKMQCQTSGFYAHWLITKAQDGTFAELELGHEEEVNPGLKERAVRALYTKSYLRRAVEKTPDGLRQAVRSEAAGAT